MPTLPRRLSCLLALTLGAPLCSSCSPSPDPQGSCAAQGRYALTEAAPVFDRSMSAAELSLANPSRQSGQIQTGRYQAWWEGAATHRRVDLPPGSDGSPRACFGALAFDASMSSTIHLAREILPGSCADAEVARHEMGHHAIQLRLQRVGADLYAARQSLPLFSGQSADIDAQMSAFAKRYARDLALAAISHAQAAHGAHDNPAEYARVSSSCQGELAPIVRLALARGR
jgi:hypothetical protein